MSPKHASKSTSNLRSEDSNGNHKMFSYYEHNLVTGVPADLPDVGNGNARGANGAPPPIPSRPSFNHQQPLTNFGMPYNSYQPNFAYSQYNHPIYRMPYNHGAATMVGYNQYNQNAFTRLVEETSRPAFHSIESLVTAATSVSAMLDSTYQALHGSFNAIVAVADNFARLRAHLVGILSALSLLRFLRYVYHKLRQLVGLPRTVHDLWNETVASTSDSAAGSSACNWPLLAYLTFIIGTPWLIWKLVQKYVTHDGNADWASGQDDHIVAKALYDFTARNTDEVSLSAGQLVNVAPKELQPAVRGWLLASSDGQTQGLIPANYILIIGRRRGKRTAPSCGEEKKMVNESDDHAQNRDDVGRLANENANSNRPKSENEDVELSLKE